MVTRTPGSGAPSRVRTRPRRTEARCGAIAFGATPVWIGLAPLNRNAVASENVVTCVRFIAGAAACGSGGSVTALAVTCIVAEKPLSVAVTSPLPDVTPVTRPVDVTITAPPLEVQ